MGNHSSKTATPTPAPIVSQAVSAISTALSAAISSLEPQPSSSLQTSSLAVSTTSSAIVPLITSSSISSTISSTFSSTISSTISSTLSSAIEETITSTSATVAPTASNIGGLAAGRLEGPLADAGSSVISSSMEVMATMASSVSSVSMVTSRTVSQAVSTTVSRALASATQTALAAAAAAESSAPLPPITVVQQPAKGPFSPEKAILGGIPTIKLDVPITAVFLVLFFSGAVSHFVRHELNGKKGHKFHLSDMVFDFCMVRTVTCIMRLVWATKPTNNSVIVAALIFENAGVVVLFAVNAVLTQRILRAIHPNIGWNPIVNKFFLGILVSVVAIIIWNIVNLTVSFFTLNRKVLETTHDLLLFGASWTTFLSLIPILIVLPATAIPSSTPVEKFGAGHFRTKVMLVIFSSATLAIGALVRLIGAVVEFPIDRPGNIDSKTVFYTTGFMLEIINVYLYFFARFDLRFWVPDGASAPGDYAKGKGESPLINNAAEMGTDDTMDFQDVDVKMRMSIADFTREKMEPGPPADGDGRSTREQVKQAISILKLKHEIVGRPIDSGDSELLIYAFRVKKPSPPPRFNGQRPSPRPTDRYPSDYPPPPQVPSGYQEDYPDSERRNSAWRRASRGYWNARQSLI